MEPPPVKRGRRALGAALAILCLPPLVAVVETVTFQVRNASNRRLSSGGEEREYLLYVPSSYDPGRPTPLVISMHGAGGWPAQQRDISGWNAVADEEGFIVAYPSGLGGRASRAWRMSRAESLAKDVRFISDLIDQVQRAYNVDPARIYANGLSAGGGMSFALSCTLSDRIAAVGTVAAARLLPWSWCTDERPVPVMTFHGTADTAVPYDGGSSWVGDITFPDVEEWVAGWARRNRCDPDAIQAVVAADVTRREYTRCAEDAAVVLFTIHGGGHTWPGGQPLPEWFLGPTSRSVDATRLMWAFFRDHPLRTR
jgi:polyhydroxybutyrate depolymerase